MSCRPLGAACVLTVWKGCDAAAGWRAASRKLAVYLVGVCAGNNGSWAVTGSFSLRMTFQSLGDGGRFTVTCLVIG